MVEHPECYDSDIRYFFINRTVWNGRVNYKIKSRLYFSNPNGWNIIYNNKIINASKLLQNTKITSIDYFNLFNSPGDQVWIFADPPYMKNTELSEASQLYENNFTKTDHINLNKIIKDCNHKVLLTYDNHPFIKELYKDFNIKEVSWTYSGTSSAKNQSKTKKHGQELIITNY